MKRRPDTPETVRIKAVLARSVSDAARAALLREPTPRENARQRALTRLPIDDTRELVCNLLDIADRIPKHTERWYFMNSLIRQALERADAEEREPK